MRPSQQLSRTASTFPCEDSRGRRLAPSKSIKKRLRAHRYPDERPLSVHASFPAFTTEIMRFDLFSSRNGQPASGRFKHPGDSSRNVNYDPVWPRFCIAISSRRFFRKRPSPCHFQGHSDGSYRYLKTTSFVTRVRFPFVSRGQETVGLVWSPVARPLTQNKRRDKKSLIYFLLFFDKGQLRCRL